VKQSVGKIALVIFLSWLSCAGFVLAGALILGAQQVHLPPLLGSALSLVLGLSALTSAVGLWRSTPWVFQAYLASAISFLLFQIWWWGALDGFTAPGIIGPLSTLLLFGPFLPYVRRQAKGAA
jgi:hypothetical protein